MAQVNYVQTIKGPETIGALLVGVVWDFLISTGMCRIEGTFDWDAYSRWAETGWEVSQPASWTF